MESEIWRIQTERIGTLESFRSERDMESFLMSNPAVLGCWDPRSKISKPTLLKQQINLKLEGDIGRIDLIGIGNREGDFELRIFELKPGDIDLNAVNQLNWYLKAWEKDVEARKIVRAEVLKLRLQGVDEDSLDSLINNPVGVLVGSKFLPESISKASKLGIRGLRIARFKAEARAEYYVIVEDQIGDVMIKRFWSWKELVDAGLIGQSDEFSISHGDVKLIAKPDPKYLDYSWKYLIFNEDSAKRLIDIEEKIREKAGDYERKWLDKEFDNLKKGKGMVITHASALFYFAFGGPYPSCYWTPTGWWKHEKSGKSLEQLRSELPG